MKWAVHEEVRPQIVWFTDATPLTIVGLGGRALHLTAIHHGELKDKSPPDAKLHHVEMDALMALEGPWAEERDLGAPG
jgi:hypothetical protein